MRPTAKHWVWFKGLTLSLITFMVVLPALAQGTTTVKVTPATLTLPVGGVVELLINVENVSNLYGIELSISFDPNVLEVIDANPNTAGVQISAGDMLSPDYEPVNQVANGFIDYALTQIKPTAPANGSGTLVRITFRGKADGTSAVTLGSILLSNNQGGGIDHTWQNGQITVGSGGTPATAVPTPVPPATTAPEQPTPIPATPVPTPIPATPVPTPVPPAPNPVAPPAVTTNFNCTRILGYHNVQRGETLYAIARAYQVDPYAIGACNRLADPRRIHFGNRLAIPNVPWIPTPPGPTAVRQWALGALPAGCRVNHTVRTGETLTLLAGRYGVGVWPIVQANRVHNPNLIYIGQTLCIP